MSNLDQLFSGGTNSTRYYGRLYYTENSVNTGANTSNITLNLVIADNNGAYTFFGYNNNGQISINGGQVASGNYTGTVNSTEHSICSWTGDVGHNPDGTLTINISFSISSGYAGGSANNTNWALTTINRYANITSYTQTPVTDEEIQLNWSADSTCDYISWWSTAYDGGGHHDTPVTPGSGPFTQTFHNLVSNKTYDFTVAVRRQDSGLWTISSTANPTTLSQNGYFNTMGL